MNILLNLTINSTESLQLITDIDDNNFINLYNTIFTIWLNKQNNLLKIDRFSVGYDIYDIIENIQSCINKKRKTPKNLGKNPNLGLLWNEHRQEITLINDSGKTIENLDWPGSKLLLFANRADGFNSSMTFLYNDDKGNIILEVCSAYPWFFGEETPQISYEQWIDQYKVLYKTTISKQLAKQWVEQLQDLYQRLENNMPS